MSNKRITWRIGFGHAPQFFALYCPEANRSRLALCEAAIALLTKAWPHLTIHREVVDVDDSQGDVNGNR